MSQTSTTPPLVRMPCSKTSARTYPHPQAPSKPASPPPVLAASTPPSTLPSHPLSSFSQTAPRGRVLRLAYTPLGTAPVQAAPDHSTFVSGSSWVWQAPPRPRPRVGPRLTLMDVAVAAPRDGQAELALGLRQAAQAEGVKAGQQFGLRLAPALQALLTHSAGVQERGWRPQGRPRRGTRSGSRRWGWGRSRDGPTGNSGPH